MKVKDVIKLLSEYPEDAEINAHVSARGFQEKLFLNSGYYDERDTKKVYLNFAFEIGWRNNHPEFWK